MEDMIHSSTSTSAASRVIERPSAQDRQEALRCPRCDSPNTKFCYYNNYSLSQPRHFCRACKRYWTRGGTLRNVPIGGGCRKNNRVKRAATVMVAPSRIIPSMSMQSSPLHLDSSSMVYSLQQTAARLSHQTLALQGLPNCNHVSSCSTSIFDDLQSAQFSVHDVHHLPQLHQYSPLSSEVLPSMDVYLLLGSLSSAAAASHLVSSPKQPKKADDYEGLFPCEELQACGEDMNILSMMKEVEAERLGNATNNYSYNNKNDMVESQILCDNSSKRFSATTATNLPNDSSVLHPAEVEAAAAAACPDAANYRSCII